MKKLESTDLAKTATDISNALIGLERYAFDNLNGPDIEVKAYDGLNGLIASIMLLAEKHAYEASIYEMEH